MRRLIRKLRIVGLYGGALLMIGAFPVQMPRASAETVEQPTTSAAPAAPTQTAEPAKPVYTYDPTTDHWNTDEWQYNGATKTYDAVPQPLPVAEQQPVQTPTTSPATTGSTTPVSAPATTNTSTNAATDAAINNTLQSNATTGNAGVVHNTTGGNATTGNALATTTQTNLVNSSLGGAMGPATFTSDINGDVHGDLVLYPMIMAALVQGASAPKADTTITATTDTAINNDIHLAATSGDAAVTGNTTAGNATTGNASAVANIINMINSVVASGSSFIGTININGNLDGDILVSPDFLPQLLAANNQQNLTANLNDTQSIANNIVLDAATGQAIVAANTTAGNATTGNATTNLTLLNLTGHNVVAKDSLLVFVNVLGTWVGMIVDAAPGSTSAALGNGVTSNSVDNTTVNSTNNAAITNNLTLSANSGDATVAHNTTAGNATTGNATASANVANISQTNIGLTGWFGVLFINVFGSWLGSFGVDTPHGNPPQVSTSSDEPAASGAAAPEAGQAIRFIANQAVSSSSLPFNFGLSAKDDTPTPPSTTIPVTSATPQAQTTTTQAAVETPVAVEPKSTPAVPTIVPFSAVMLTIILAGVALRRLLADAAITGILAS